ncbi:hypothetical protein ACTMTJ_03240 [Phytohabitans sp. LJ34]|uniref:hypothetical protein n=1 Tax=Phytohabitans sp. LJ34 TaxID=3452217 RepID=UPI003F897A93
MTGFRRTRLALIGATCLLALGVPAGPALAVPSEQWSPVSCATGAITGFGVRVDEGRTLLGLSGWVQPCLPAEPANGFAVIVYRGMGAGIGTPILPYGSPAGPTEFTVDVALVGSGDTVGNELLAACLAYAPYGRLACLGIDEGSREAPPVVAPLPVDAPAVLGMVVDTGGPVRRNPVCGTCL